MNVISFISQGPKLTILPCIGINCGFPEILVLVVLIQVLNYPLATDPITMGNAYTLDHQRSYSRAAFATSWCSDVTSLPPTPFDSDFLLSPRSLGAKPSPFCWDLGCFREVFLTMKELLMCLSIQRVSCGGTMLTHHQPLAAGYVSSRLSLGWHEALLVDLM
ncbi:uncharacterized protein EV420DRAFT_195656 [Desarmillaria tabescens]|uniref:Uncharacterized protein n=1 Tax=Armillaria tabescens TaxID=1929756 RepID=A0AA39TJK8_ARMTA|nr:uncharacterized protein EV420DRAFT_195656 [Desarmillaria tabescens]KAK0461367.1 hypothetical protein EV420DRAFT_195656 [Desarmillaria tabescens]